MSYSVTQPVGYPVAALGYDFTIGTPAGDMTFSIPIEQLAKDAGTMALNAAAPLEVDLLKKTLPDLLKQSEPWLNAQVNLAIGKAKTAGTALESNALDQLGKVSAFIIGGVFIAAFVVRGRKRA